MHSIDLISTLLSPAILCFALGLAAPLLRSDLELPAPLSRTLSLYLLFAIGVKGGISLSASGLSGSVIATLAAAGLTAVAIPVACFFILKRRMSTADAAAVAAAYGSVSAVTFIAAVGLLNAQGVAYSGHMIAALALMESPAIVVGVWLARKFSESEKPVSWSHIGKDAFLNSSVFLLLGSLLVGLVCGPERGAALKPFTETLFPGALCLFLLDLGIVAGKRLGGLKSAGAHAIGFAVFAPFVNAALGLMISIALGLSRGDALLFVVLCGGASYIAVPAAMRIALPSANPGLYVTLSLGLTFPLNLLVGLPLFDFAVNRFIAA